MSSLSLSIGVGATPQWDCPLCQSPGTQLRENVRVADIDKEYRRQFGIGVLSEFPPGLLSVSWRHCRACQLDFFAPMVTGSKAFYSSLARTPGYYTTARWEFDETLRRLPAEPDLIDVGCGDGHFLRKVPGTLKRGLEFNLEAVRRARLSGLLVTQDSLESLPDGSTDHLTLFQVLEHVADPASLVRQAARVLRPEGRLFLSVPNNDAYVGSAMHDPMNAPPHHPLRWRPAAFAYLERVAPLQLLSVTPEPLGAEQVYHYRRARFMGTLRALSGNRMPLHRVSASMTAVRRVANVWAQALSRLKPNPPAGAHGPSILVEYRRLDVVADARRAA